MVAPQRWPAAFRWLGAAGFQLRFGPTHILVDPFLSHSQDGGLAGVDDLLAEAIFLTHGHFDHVRDAPAIAAHTRAPVYASATVCAALHDRGLAARQLHPLAAGRTVEVGAVEVRAFAARHVRFDLPLVWRTLGRAGARLFGVLRAVSMYPQGEVLGYRFVGAAPSVVHLGSAGFYPSELAQMRSDVALLPLQGRSDIERVVLRMVRLLQPRRVVLHHFDDFYPPISAQIDVRPFIELLARQQPDVRVIAPRVGEWTRI